jgi:hypothetical protein
MNHLPRINKGTALRSNNNAYKVLEMWMRGNSISWYRLIDKNGVQSAETFDSLNAKLKSGELTKI